MHRHCLQIRIIRVRVCHNCPGLCFRKEVEQTLSSEMGNWVFGSRTADHSSFNNWVTDPEFKLPLLREWKPSFPHLRVTYSELSTNLLSWTALWFTDQENNHNNNDQTDKEMVRQAGEGRVGFGEWGQSVVVFPVQGRASNLNTFWGLTQSFAMNGQCRHQYVNEHVTASGDL